MGQQLKSSNGDWCEMANDIQLAIKMTYWNPFDRPSCSDIEQEICGFSQSQQNTVDLESQENELNQQSEVDQE